MSWFSRPFSASLPSGQGRPREDKEDMEITEMDDEDVISPRNSPTGKGVREDLSELRKTLTRQLWGVASFLALPPEEALEEGSTEGETAELLVGGYEEDEDRGVVISSPHADEKATFGTKGDLDALGTVHPSPEKTLPKIAGKAPAEDSQAPSRGLGEQLWGPDHGLLGIRSDIAELTGSLSTGLSRFSSSVIRAVAGEDFDAHAKSSPGSPRSQSGDSEHSSRNVGFNALLKPILDNLLARDVSESDGGKDIEFEPWGAEDEQAESSEVFKDGSKASTQDDFPTALATGISEFSKLASSFLPFSLDSYSKASDGSEERLLATGVTNEVIAFASNIAMHPETWLDFPLAGDEEEDDFQLSVAQHEHVSALELQAPSLAALRIEMCPEYMSEGRFWKIYFVLLQSRLNKEDSELLCTPQIVEARKYLLNELLKREGRNQESELLDEHASEMGRVHGWLEDNSKSIQDQGDAVPEPKPLSPLAELSPDAALGPDTFSDETKAFELLKTGNAVLDPVAGDLQKQTVSSKLQLEDDNGDAEEWLDEDPLSNEAGAGGNAALDEDVSFSDLEDEDTSLPSSSQVAEGRKPSPVLPKGDTDLVSTEGNNEAASAKSDRLESDDWLTVNEEDVASADSS